MYVCMRTLETNKLHYRIMYWIHCGTFFEILTIKEREIGLSVGLKQFCMRGYTTFSDEFCARMFQNCLQSECLKLNGVTFHKFVVVASKKTHLWPFATKSQRDFSSCYFRSVLFPSWFFFLSFSCLLDFTYKLACLPVWLFVSF